MWNWRSLSISGFKLRCGRWPSWLHCLFDQSSYVPTLTCDPKLWVERGRMRSSSEGWLGSELGHPERAWKRAPPTRKELANVFWVSTWYYAFTRVWMCVNGWIKCLKKVPSQFIITNLSFYSFHAFDWKVLLQIFPTIISGVISSIRLGSPEITKITQV